jgi:hypothetical protein
MLLSFAQFEREVTGERIRDKIAASKRKGLWMGGPVPLGYEADGRTLTINQKEAETIRTLFRLYLELGSVQRVQEEAQRLGLTTKVRRGAGRRMRGGRPLSRGHLYRLLGNPLYVGRIAHHGDSHDGQHAAIVDSATWEAVQKRLAAQTPARTSRTDEPRPSPLRGKLFDEAGVALTPSHAVKSGRRYRYYVSRDPSPGATAGASNRRSPRWRLPAREIERVVEEAIVTLFASPAELIRLAKEAGIHEARVSDLLEAVRHWTGAPLEQVQRVDLSTKEISVIIDLTRILGEEGAAVRHGIPARIRRRGVEMRLVLDSGQRGSSGARVDPALVKAIVRARQWFERLASGRARSLVEIAQAEGVTDGYVGQLIPLAVLAPDIVAGILSGTQPVDLTTQTLTKRTDLPLDWTEQRALLGFD